MRKWLHIVWFRFRYMMKSPATVIFLIVLPIVFSLIFGNLNTSSEEHALPAVAIVSGESQLEQEIGELFARNKAFEWIHLDEEQATEQVKERSIVAAIKLPDDLLKRIEQKQAIFQVIVNQKTEQYIPLSNLIANVSNQLSTLTEIVAPVSSDDALTKVLELANAEPILAVQKQSFTQYEEQTHQDTAANNRLTVEQTIDTTTTMPIGFSLMFLLFTLSGAATVIHTERTSYTWQRLTISSATKKQIVGGYITSFWLIGWVQFAVLMIFMYIMFHTQWGNFALIIPFVSLIILCVVAYSMMMATLVHSKKQGDALNSIIIVSTCMLGGVYWPLSIVPSFMQTVGKYIPQYWMMEGVQRIMMGGNDWTSLWQPFVIVLILSIAMLGIAIWRLSKELKV